MTAPACPLTAAELRGFANNGDADSCRVFSLAVNDVTDGFGRWDGDTVDTLALWLADAIEAKEKAEAEMKTLRADLSDAEMVIVNYLPVCVGDCGCEGALAGCAILGDDPEATAIAEAIAVRRASNPGDKAVRS